MAPAQGPSSPSAFIAAVLCIHRRYDVVVSDDARREAALSLMQGRFPAVAARVRQVYGLRLPRHVAVFCALWASASSAERAALEHLMVRPFGLTEYFGAGGLRLTGRDGLDERLHARYRRDPPEFVTVLGGGTDGLHYGLWYDDPAGLPSLLVYNYARDDAVTRASSAATMLAEIRREAQQAVQDFGGDEDDEDVRLILPVFAALDWFADADQRAGSRWPPARHGCEPAVQRGFGVPCARSACSSRRERGHRLTR